MLAAGDLDPGFGTGGKVSTEFIGPTRNNGRGVALQPDGKLVVVGDTLVTGGVSDFALSRYNADGSLDTSFGTGGSVTTDFGGGNAGATAVALQSDGKIVVAGNAFGSSENFALARYNSNGSLDTSFGVGGKVTTDFSSYDDSANAVVLQADGKIVAVGFASNTSTSEGHDFALARYNTDGSLDSSFGTGGKVTTAFSSVEDVANAAVMQSDGKIVVAGAAPPNATGLWDFALARYNTDGSLDGSFGSGGEVRTDFGVGNGTDWASGVVLQSDGKIIAAGAAGESSFGLARYNVSGSLDTSFGTGGKVTTPFSGGDAAATAVKLELDNKIVAAGYAHASTGSTYDFALARYNASGSLDTTFGSKGKLQTEFSGSGSNDHAYGVVLQSDGKIIAAGTSYSDQTSEDFALARYTTSGGLDTTFDADGKVTTDYLGPTQNRGQAVALQADGKIVVAGYTSDDVDSFSSDFSVSRYNADGSLDANFGAGGEVRTDIGSVSGDSVSGVAIQSDGKIVVVGSTASAVGTGDFVLVRYTASGSLDTSFGTGGKVTTDFSRRIDHASAVAIQGDGKVVVAGLSYTVGRTGANNDNEFALARYNTDGSLDSSFGSRGKVLTSIGSGAADAFGVALQSDGKIVVAGRAIGSSPDIAVARYTAGGSLDTTFGSGGTVLTDFAGYGDQALGVALQGDGKILVAGETNPGSGYDDFALARYTTSGSLDTTFGVGGKVTTDFAGSDDEAFGVAIQSDGRIVAAGYTRSSTAYNYDFALARYLGSAAAPQTLGGAVAASTGATNPTVAYQSRRWGSTSISPDAVGAFPRGPLGVALDMAPWVSVPPIAAHPRRARGAPSLWLMTLNPDSLPLADRGS